MSSAIILYGVLYYYRPKKSLADWGRQEALKRMAERDGEDGDEDDE